MKRKEPRRDVEWEEERGWKGNSWERRGSANAVEQGLGAAGCSVPAWEGQVEQHESIFSFRVHM